MTTPCFLRARPEEEKGEGASGRDGSRKHAGEKRGGSCKDPSIPRHRVFVIGGRGPGGGEGAKASEGGFQILADLATVVLRNFDF